MRLRTLLVLAAYVATVPAANWMIQHVGSQSFPGAPHTIPVGFGFSAPSGVLLIGVALAARDYIQRTAGKCSVLVAIACGVALSYVVNPAIATASAAAFLLGEVADFAVFTPISRRSLPAAVLASGITGGVIDSFVFLQLAFGSTMFWQGQVVGKSLVAAVCALSVIAYRAVSIRLTACEA